MIQRRTLFASLVAAAALGAVAAVALGVVGLTDLLSRLSAADMASGRIEVWHGSQQKVGHLGEAQADFNLIGRVKEPSDLLSLQYAVNDDTPVELNFHGYRRLAADGHFNADIPIAALRHGPNTIELKGRFADGSRGRQVVTVHLRRCSSSPMAPHRLLLTPCLHTVRL